MLAISEGLNLGVVKVTRVGKNQWACVEMKTPGRTFTGEKEARSTLAFCSMLSLILRIGWADVVWCCREDME